MESPAMQASQDDALLLVCIVGHRQRGYVNSDAARITGRGVGGLAIAWDSTRSPGRSESKEPAVTKGAMGEDGAMPTVEPTERVVVEELEISVRALNFLKANDIRFVDQVVISSLRNHQNSTPVIGEIRQAILKFHGMAEHDGFEEHGALVPR
jgi:hypothetical protein